MNHDGVQSVTLRCIGKVLRTRPTDGEDRGTARAFQIAATLERYEFVRE